MRCFSALMRINGRSLGRGIQTHAIAKVIRVSLNGPVRQQASLAVGRISSPI
jgi:hypothetical protein